LTLTLSAGAAVSCSILRECEVDCRRSRCA
jgi:hypothetical protein